VTPSGTPPGTPPVPTTVPSDTSDSAPDTGGEVTDGEMTEEPLPPPPQVVTSSDGAFWVTGTYTTGAEGNADVTVSDNGNQPWLGFGGTFNEAGWDALLELSEGDRQRAIDLLFDAADGANFTYGRI